MPSFVSTRLIALVLLAIQCTAVSAAQNSEPVINAELLSDKLYVGEMPHVRITITAPHDQDIPVISEDRIYKRQVLDLDLYNVDGSSVPGGLPSVRGIESHDDFSTLEAGKSVKMEFSILKAPPSAGEYTVHVSFSPYPNGSIKFRKDLKLTCQDIPQQAIRSKASMVVPLSRNAGTDLETVELMNVNTGSKYELIYRRAHTRGVKFCERLLSLGEDSNIIAITRENEDPEKDVTSREIWLTYNKAAELYFVRIEWVTGKVLEETIMKPKGK